MASLLKLTSCFHARTSSSRASLPDDWILFLFLGNSGSFFNFSQTHKWSGILTCLSLQKGVYSFRINEWIRSWLSLCAHHPPSMCTRTLEGGRLVSIRWLENFDHMALSARKMKTKDEPAVCDGCRVWPRCVAFQLCPRTCTRFYFFQSKYCVFSIWLPN